MPISFIKLQLQYIELDFKREYLFRTCSVATDLVTSHQFQSSLCYYAVPFLLANYGATPYPLNFTPIAALLQAVQQAITEPFRNGLVETRNWTVKTSRNHNTGPKWSKMMMEYGLSARNLNFVLFYAIKPIIIFISQFLKSVWSFVYIIIYSVGAGISTFMSISDGLGAYFSRRKLERRGLWGKKWMERCLFAARVGINCLCI